MPLNVVSSDPAVMPRLVGQSRISRVRRHSYHFAAVLIGVLPFVVFELVCIAAGWGDADTVSDPYVEFDGKRPLFVLTDDGTSFHTAPNRRGYFKEDSFSATKAEDEFRVFVFGGSTVQGSPFSIETSFPTYLQIALETAAPGRRWKVVNCGGVSYASYRLLPVMDECFRYEPDLYIFCEGHNEFLEDVEYADVRESSPTFKSAFTLASHFHSFRLLRQVLSDPPRQADSETSRSSHGQPLLPVEVDTLLDHEGGLAAYQRDDDHAAAVAAHFRTNLLKASELCRDRNVPLLFILPPSNLRDSPPFKSEFDSTTFANVQFDIARLLRTACDVASSDLSQAVGLASQARDLDPRYARSWYELAQLQELAGLPDAAQSYRTARDEDICPLRMTTSLEHAMRSAARDSTRPLLDAHALLAERCAGRIVGGSVLVDHVHPSFRGHEDIAVAIADWMMNEQYLVPVNPLWAEHSRTECGRRLQRLDDLYFLRGQRSLQSMQLWSAGRSGGPPLAALPERRGSKSVQQ